MREIKNDKEFVSKREEVTMIWDMEEEIMVKNIKWLRDFLHFTIFAVVGAILYGRILIKTEKTDAVFEIPNEHIGIHGCGWI